MSATDVFAHSVGDIVLVRWRDERIYFAKIQSISKNRRVCKIVFEDGEQVSVPFEDVYSGKDAQISSMYIEKLAILHARSKGLVVCFRRMYGERVQRKSL